MRRNISSITLKPLLACIDCDVRYTTENLPFALRLRSSPHTELSRLHCYESTVTSSLQGLHCNVQHSKMITNERKKNSSTAAGAVSTAAAAVTETAFFIKKISTSTHHLLQSPPPPSWDQRCFPTTSPAAIPPIFSTLRTGSLITTSPVFPECEGVVDASLEGWVGEGEEE